MDHTDLTNTKHINVLNQSSEAVQITVSIRSHGLQT